MAKPVWQQKLQARLDRNPLYWEEPTAEEKAANVHAHRIFGVRNAGASLRVKVVRANVSR